MNSGTDWHSASIQARTYWAIRSPIRPTVRVRSAEPGQGPPANSGSVPALTLWNQSRRLVRSASGSVSPTHSRGASDGGGTSSSGSAPRPVIRSSSRTRPPSSEGATSSRAFARASGAGNGVGKGSPQPRVE